MEKAFAYLRVSGKGQIQGDGFPRQLEAVKTYAAAHGMMLANIYRERGVSGTAESMDRPTWVEMVGAILTNGVRTVIIERLDRLARDLMVQEHILQDLQRHGIKLISVAEPDLCSDDPSRKLMRHIMGAIAEYDRCMTVLKLRGARERQRKREGRCEGAKRYGTKPGEAETLKRIQVLRSAGQSPLAIAKTLNDSGVPPRRGTKWHPFTIGRMLQRSV